MFSASAENTPQLITFKVGDLMRCKCSSKQKQILALYKEIERRHRQPDSGIKIIRVKNRLNKGNKDILMNLMYKGEMVVEMQLAIKSDKSKFIECSYNFNHYLYELKRAQFGPIMQMCSIWVNKDLKSKFYLQKMEKVNKRIKPDTNKQQKQKLQEKLEKCCEKNKTIIKLPFRCTLCTCFYSNSSQVQKNIYCQKCHNYTCYICQLQISDVERLKLFNEINKDSSQKFQHAQAIQKIQGGGVIFNLKSKKKKPLYYIIAHHKNQNFMFEYDKTKNQVKLIQKFKSQVFSESFLRQNIVFTSPSIKNQIKIIQKQAQSAKNNYFVNKYLKQAYKTEKNSIYLPNQKINQQKLKVQGIETWPSVVSLNFSQGKQLDINKIVYKFPNVKSAILNDVEFEEFPILWKQLKVLEFKGNKLTDFGLLKNCQKLTQINLSVNSLKQLPKTDKNLKYLKKLIISNNKIEEYPEQLCNLQNLQQLNLSSNKLSKNLPKQFGNLTSLHKLTLKNNQLKQLPQSIGQLQKIQNINLSINKFITLPQSFGLLSSLKQLSLNHNKIQNLLDSFTKLQKLQILHLETNCLTLLPETMGNLRSLKQLFLNNNKLQKLPQSICNIRSLQILNVLINKLSQLPESFGNLQRLQELYLSDNLIEKLPESFGNLQKLNYLFLIGNKIQNLPESFSKLEQLKNLYLNNNNLTTLPQNFGHLHSLQQLYLQKNALVSLPSSFTNLHSLKFLQLDKNKLESLPTAMGNLTSLQAFSMYDNPISEIPPTLFRAEKLKNCGFSVLVDLANEEQAFSNIDNANLTISLDYERKFQEKIEKIKAIVARSSKCRIMAKPIQKF